MQFFLYNHIAIGYSAHELHETINMKTITLICAIGLVANIAMGLYNLSQNFARMAGAGSHVANIYLLSQGIWICTQCALVAFFLTLYSRQK